MAGTGGKRYKQGWADEGAADGQADAQIEPKSRVAQFLLVLFIIISMVSKSTIVNAVCLKTSKEYRVYHQQLGHIIHGSTIGKVNAVCLKISKEYQVYHQQ